MKSLKVISLFSIFFLMVNPILPSFMNSASASSMYSSDASKFKVQVQEKNNDSIRWKVTVFLQEELDEPVNGSLNLSSGLGHGQVGTKLLNGSPSDFGVHSSSSGYQFSLSNGPGTYEFEITTLINQPDVMNYRLLGRAEIAGQTYEAFDEVFIVPDTKVELTVQQSFLNAPTDLALPSVNIHVMDSAGQVVDSSTISNGQASHTFNELQKYASDGSVRQYSVYSEPLEQFDTVQNGTTFTHTYIVPKEELQENTSGGDDGGEGTSDDDPDPERENSEEDQPEEKNGDEGESEGEDSEKDQSRNQSGSEDSTKDNEKKDAEEVAKDNSEEKQEDTQESSKKKDEESNDSEEILSMQSTGNFGILTHQASNEYHIDSNAIVAETVLSGASQNQHTYPELLWSYQGTVYIAVESTHGVEEVVINGISSTDIDEFAPSVDLIIGGTTYEHVDPQGNKKDAHWAVAKFPLSSLGLLDGGQYVIEINSQVGKGHDVEGTIEIIVPKIDVTGEKLWVGGDTRPAVDLVLFHGVDGEPAVEVATGVVDGTEDPAWSYTWEDVNKYDPYGRLYEFFVDEVEVPVNYDKTLNGMTVTNTYNPDQISIPITKEWIGEGLEEATFKLFADGIHTGLELVLNDSNNWQGSFENLNKFDDATGVEIQYTVEEVELDDYSTEVEGSVEEGFVFTNTNDTTTSLPVEKVWEGPELESVTVELLANGEATGVTMILNEANSWSATFTDLRNFDATTGESITYSAIELDVSDIYDVSYSAVFGGKLTITNTIKAGGDVTAKYEDEDGNEIADSEVFSGNIGDSYNTEQKEIDGYRFKEVIGDPSGEFTEDPQTVTYVYEKIIGSLTVTKVDEEGNVITSDYATFGLYDLQGNLIETVDTVDGIAVFEDLELGDYELFELKAPSGYRKLISPIDVSITGDEVGDEHVEKDVVNTLQGWEIPATGGIGSVGFYTIGIIIMMLAMWALLRRGKHVD
ncbi:Cna B-type domain-containing protein [Halalkalibacillus sediminis]|nr:Cna B-type domain-containing protein [Halalkalibacillus sediminis]